jgi:hypothetical protein
MCQKTDLEIAPPLIQERKQWKLSKKRHREEGFSKKEKQKRLYNKYFVLLYKL